MNSHDDKINELLLDNRFVDWVVNPGSPYQEYWLQWIHSNPANQELADEAKRFLLELRKGECDNEVEIDAGTTEQMLSNIHREISKSTTQQHSTLPGFRKYWMAAAVVAGLLLVAAAIIFRKQEMPQALQQSPPDMEVVADVVRFNGGNRNELVYLPDGSRVTLARGARIVYNRLMSGKKRNVTLNGEAFFDVAKNPERPFYIHTQRMVIKVLGTSFRVKTSHNEESVIVKTGKVSVYLKEQDLEESAARILLPRQVCTYSTNNNTFTTSAYASASKIEIAADSTREYNFEEAPLSDVLQSLEKMYDLPIHFDKNAFRNCLVTISLDNESLEDKLEVLTKTVGASFSISDYGISIKGKGCD